MPLRCACLCLCLCMGGRGEEAHGSRRSFDAGSPLDMGALPTEPPLAPRRRLVSSTCTWLRNACNRAEASSGLKPGGVRGACGADAGAGAGAGAAAQNAATMFGRFGVVQSLPPSALSSPGTMAPFREARYTSTACPPPSAHQVHYHYHYH
ncbi:uncharacterized protein SETTUDRAFT_34573 [Exserohilum turcica Et28A]|uniref:Uncharacterized protein n=1 Tax=Exserohilum turcicum (strain 28A) TaxID=671987 RepID=R0I8E1_EXST2|nr:uncharacterized protein SETTUDRAFT_34573 [Exserohilum turcica Et28A]EOA81795.1 hypothetical protein SETTUDRAFT_34573 [Exserohilum turcica Et28A]